MSFEYLIEKENKIKKLTDGELTALAGKISADFDEFNDQRRSNLDKADALSREIFFKWNREEEKANEVGVFSDTKKDNKNNWKTKVKICKTYMLYQTLKAFIWKNVYANVNSMFDVSGENQEADNDSNKQKAALVDVFEKMNYQKTCDKVIDYSLIHGELITMCSWKKKSEEYRKRIDANDILTKKSARDALAKGKFHFIDEKIVYDNPYVIPVNPAFFAFDVAQKDNWDECPKIFKSYKVPDDIINNQYYTVSDDVAQAIKSSIRSSFVDRSQMDKDLEDETINGGTVEVLEHWGNLRMPDGTLLKNWHVVVVARKYVVRFKKNNRIINPFTYGAFIVDPETQRGISPLFCVLSLAKLQEDLLNRTCDMQSLSENPPIYAPRGFFDKDEIELYPGKIIEFGDNLSPSEIQQMSFAVSVFLNDITFISDQISETSGIFPNMAGADEKGNKTATEISTKAQGQLTRLSMLIDTINQDMIVSDVKKVAKLCADFKTGDENLFVTKGNDKETIVINDRIRKAEYRYTYADRTATTERSNKADLIVSAAKEFAQFIPLNGHELFTWYMEQKDVENPERFLQVQATIPTEIQSQLMADPRIKQLVEVYNQQKNERKNNQEQQNYLPDASIAGAQVDE